jgi:hypothetical protein
MEETSNTIIHTWEGSDNPDSPKDESYATANTLKHIVFANPFNPVETNAEEL